MPQSNSPHSKSIAVIGSGFSSLAASCYLAQMGYEVNVFEKNAQLGGRARQFKKDGFTFDMGPTFYWMPDVFERFFNDFGKSVSDYYSLLRLDPGYSIVFGEGETLEVSSHRETLMAKFEEKEQGAGAKLNDFLLKAEDNYKIAIQDLVYQPGENILEIAGWETAKRLPLFARSIRKDVAKYVTHPQLKMALEFPVLFLGAKPSDTPAFYNFMNYADYVLGTWHPKGGMHMVVKGMEALALELGVQFHTNSPVEQISVDSSGSANGVFVNQTFFESDMVLSGADYAHTETLIDKSFRQYSSSYWEKKTFAPSALLFYVGLNTRIPNVEHHTLFFDADFEEHAHAIYDEPAWPKKPLFYASFPTKTDPEMGPIGCETGIFLVPLATGLEDTDEMREAFFQIIEDRLYTQSGVRISEHILVKESYCVNDFKDDYNSYGGNAYGLANTLFQTHILRPNLRSRKVKNLYFTGQLTVPGPGVPPSLISGKLSASLLKKHAK